MPRDPRAYLQRAEEHRRHGRLKEAIALSIEALGKHPGLDAVRVTLGRAYLENAQPEEARATLLEVFARLPEHHLAGKMLIESQRLLGDLAGAETTCRTLLEHYPRDREIEPLLAEIVHARATEAAPGPAAPSGPVAATAPPAAPANAERPGVPAVAVRESDPQQDYFPEDLAAAPVTPAPARAVAPPAPRPSARAQDVASPVAPPRPVPAPAIAATAPLAAVAKPEPLAPPPIAAAPATVPSQVPSAPALAVPHAAPMASVPAPPVAPVASAPARSVAAASPAPPTATATPPTATATPPAAVAPPAPNRPAAQRDALETNTLAELYVKQGLPDRAIAVYRSMLRVEPGNAAAGRRLAELEAAAPAPAAPAAPAARATAPEPARRPTAPPAASRAAAGIASASGVASAPASASPAAAPGLATPPPAERVLAPADRAAIERLERWLVSVKAGRDRQGGGATA